MGKKYENPPLIEAVCVFRLPPDTKWDQTIPGLLYEKVKADFPVKEERAVEEFDILDESSGERKHLQIKNLVFLSKDKRTFIQVRPKMLAVNRLKPYLSWQEFKPRIEFAFNAINELTEIKALQGIGLRYINRIEIPEKQITLEDYFAFGVRLDGNLPQCCARFIAGSVAMYNQDTDACKFELFSAVPDQSGNSAFILDIDYTINKPNSVAKDQAINWIEKAHERIEEIFEECIKDKLRDIFHEIN